MIEIKDYAPKVAKLPDNKRKKRKMMVGQDTVNEEDFLGFESSQEVAYPPVVVKPDEVKVLK